MSPRSILKQSSHSIHRADAPGALLAAALPYPPEPPQVHFPPTPSLAKTYPTHSGSAYDRAPIVVLPNDCALPERGCPGRTYTTCSRSRSSNATAGSSKDRCSSASATGKHVHPRVVEDMRNRQSGPPPLIPDISSSESDESDGVVSPPPEYNSVSAGATTQHYYAYPVSIASTSQEELNKALAFLPHAPSLPLDSKASPKSNKDRDRKRRSTNGSGMPRFKSEDNARSFAETSLDGCLGGF